MRIIYLLIALLLCLDCSPGKANDDSFKGIVFDRTVQVMFTPNGAKVSGDDNNTVSVEGNHVTVRNTTTQKVLYELSGTSQDGSLKLYSSERQAIVLNGVELTNPKGAAINNQGRKKCFVVVNGNNSLTDGTKYSRTPDGEDEKAALFSEGQLVFCGDGNLTMNAKGKSGTAAISPRTVHARLRKCSRSSVQYLRSTRKNQLIRFSRSLYLIRRHLTYMMPDSVYRRI